MNGPTSFEYNCRWHAVDVRGMVNLLGGIKLYVSI
jgi:hypothetical protein